MSCERFEERLTALSDGELGGFTAWRTRRHLARCPRCAALYADIQHVTDAARDWRTATGEAATPGDLSDRVRTLISATSEPTATFEEVAGPVFARKESTMQPTPAPFFATLVRPVAIAAAVIACAVGVGTHLVPGTPKVAFADVQRAVQQVHTAHVRFRIQTGVGAPDAPPVEKENGTVFDAWLRAEPPGFAMNMPGGMRLIGDNKGMVMYTGPGAEPMRVSSEPMTVKAIRDALLSPDALLHDDDLGGRRNRPGAAPGTLANWGTPEAVKGADGRSLLRFRAADQGVQRSLWVDPETRLPVRVEVDQVTPVNEDPAAGARTTASTLVTIEFAYNEVPPAGVFGPQARDTTEPVEPSDK